MTDLFSLSVIKLIKQKKQIKLNKLRNKISIDNNIISIQLSYLFEMMI